MYTQTIENNPMKEKTQLVSNFAISALSAFLVISGIILSMTLSLVLLPFVLINLYLIKRRFNHMMQSQSSMFEQGDIIEGEFTISEETVSGEIVSEKKEP